MPNLNYHNTDTGNGLMINTIHLILLIDNSYSMKGSRIAQVNQAIPKIKKKLSEIAADHDVDLTIRVIAFSDNAVWKVGSVEAGVPIAVFTWTDLAVDGGTSTNKAIREAAKALQKRNLLPNKNTKLLRPVVILLTDGYCNPDEQDDYLSAIDELKRCLADEAGKEQIMCAAIGVEIFNLAELNAFASLSRPCGANIEADCKPLVFAVPKAEALGAVIEQVVPASVLSSINAGEDLSMISFPTSDGPTPLISEGSLP